jgi:hypothetical protein
LQTGQLPASVIFDTQKIYSLYGNVFFNFKQVLVNRRQSIRSISLKSAGSTSFTNQHMNYFSSFLKKCLVLIFICTGIFPVYAQVSNTLPYTWIKGDNGSNNVGVYGTLGVSAATNKPGGREGCGINWTDTSGNLWLFGGSGYATASNGPLNDLWKYDPITNNWTWINGDNTTNNLGVYGTKGVASPANKPGARSLATTWTDTSGNLWLFGGSGYSASTYGFLNELWKYNIALGQWTWVSGDNTPNSFGIYGTKGVAAAGNMPGGRSRTCRPDGKADANDNLWLLGGNGNAAATSGDLNDLWKYNIASNKWTWVSGDNIANATGVYGTMGVAAAANKPGARVGGLSWIDSANKFWLCGGSGSNANWSPKYSDLWKYDPVTDQWTWMKGDNTTDQYGVYGTQGVTAASSNPGGRLMSKCWIDNYGNFWLFGGYGFSAIGTGSAVGTQGLNDMWKYDPLTNNWTWMKGDNLPSMTCVYGTQGVAAASNKLGERSGGDQWKDRYGNLWQLGGIEWISSSYKNDLWKLVIPQPVAKGNLLSCQALPSITIDNSNNNTWVPVFDSKGNIAAEINANGNNLGIVNTSLYTKTGACREDISKRLYLNRNITITPQNQPLSGNVSVRLYILKDELDTLRLAYNSLGQSSGVLSINEVDVFKNNDVCATVGSLIALPLTATTGSYNSDFYLQVNVSSFSSFYFANKILTAILPVEISSFTGKKAGPVNVLQWQANCNMPQQFNMQRSSDGLHFETIATFNAVDCNHPFNFTDNSPLSAENYYRVGINTAGGASKYSAIILLRNGEDKNLYLSLQPNIAGDNLHLLLDAVNPQPVELCIVDLAGRMLLRRQLTVQAGNNQFSINTGILAKGIYIAYCSGKTGRSNMVRFVME